MSNALPAPWATTYSAVLVSDNGCGGPSTNALLTADLPLTRQFLQDTWSAVREKASAIERDYKTHREPPPPFTNSQARWEGTWGEHRAHEAALSAKRTQWYNDLGQSQRASATKLWADAGLTQWHPSTLLEESGLDYYDAPVAGPLAVLHHRGCRCAGGDSSYADWASEQDTMTLSATLAHKDRRFIVFSDSGTWPDLVTDLAVLDEAFCAAKRTRQAYLTARHNEHETRLWAHNLTKAEIDTLDYDTYERYRRARPMKMGSVGWSYPKPAPDHIDHAAWANDAEKAAMNRLARDGLFVLETLA
jgi:hypothetical protein